MLLVIIIIIIIIIIFLISFCYGASDCDLSWVTSVMFVWQFLYNYSKVF